MKIFVIICWIFLSVFLFTDQCLASCVIAIKYIDGIAIGSDSQSTAPGMIGNRETKKIFLLSENTVMCCGNGVLDFHRLYQELVHEIRINSLLYDTILDVDAIAKFSRQLINKKYKSAHVLIVGLTNKNLSKIYEITPSGSCFEQDYAIAGSCSSSLYPLLEQFCQVNQNNKNNLPTQKSSSILFPTSQSIISQTKQQQQQKDFDPFTLKPQLLSQSLIHSLTSDTALNYLHILLNYAMKMDPQSGGRLSQWILCKRQGFKKVSSSCSSGSGRLR